MQQLAPNPHMLRPTPGQESTADQALREHLLRHVAPSELPSHHQQQSQPQRTHAGFQEPVGTASGHRHPIDPAIAGPGMMRNSPGDSGDDAGGMDKRGSKRELSTSKRAAQNRAAQRAFRQRKEIHIKKLEDQVRDYQLLHDNYRAVQAENYQLRDYIITLQSRLLESQTELPPPPENVDLRQALPVPDGGMEGMGAQSAAAPTAPMAPMGLSQLQVAESIARAATGDGTTDPALRGREGA